MKLEWKEITFKEFVDLSQNLEKSKTGIIAPGGYWIEWSKRNKHLNPLLRYESEPNGDRMDITRMDRLYKRVK